MNTEKPMPSIVGRAAWHDARVVLLQQEKALTRMKDAVSAARRRMPMVEVRSDYAFDGPQGRVGLLDMLDLTPFGRQETWETSPPGWPQEPTYSWMRLSDRYEATPGVACQHHTSD